MQLNRGVISDSDDEGESRITVFADRAGNEYSAWSRRRCHMCRTTEYPEVLTRCMLCKHHVHGKPCSNYTMRLGYPSVTTPNRHLQCGASSTIG
eukprot:6262329-Amphidinium_carterae.1